MGFNFVYATKEQAHNEALKSYDGASVTIEKEVNGHYWELVKEVESGKEFIEVLFIEKSDIWNAWGYKFIAEMSGIQVYDCPLEFLDVPTEFPDKEWRRQVYLYHRDSRTLED
jgi:hypothetical protein